MPAECTVCSSPRVGDIDKALDGRSVRDVAAGFGFSKSTVARHAQHRKRPETSPQAVEGELVPSAAMPRRPCLVCRCPARETIEAALLRGEPAETLEGHGPSADTIRRHAQRCIPAMLRGARDGQTAELVQQARVAIEELMGHARQLAEDARDAGTIRERAAALGALARAAELLGKITGELGPDVEIRVLELPQWAALQATIMTALRPFPDAYDAVLSALRGQGAPALRAPVELDVEDEDE